MSAALRISSRWLQLPIDLTLVAVAWWLAFWLRFNLDTPDEFQAMMVNTLPWPLLGFAVSLLGWGVYRHIWRYTSVAELMRLVYGVALAACSRRQPCSCCGWSFSRARCCCCTPCWR